MTPMVLWLCETNASNEGNELYGYVHKSSLTVLPVTGRSDTSHRTVSTTIDGPVLILLIIIYIF